MSAFVAGLKAQASKRVRVIMWEDTRGTASVTLPADAGDAQARTAVDAIVARTKELGLQVEGEAYAIESVTKRGKPILYVQCDVRP